jgi:alcohol dehydrogenase
MFQIRGAVPEHIGSPRPYAESRYFHVAERDLAPPRHDEVTVRIEAAYQ